MILRSILDMLGNKIQNVGTPSAGTDAANKDYVDTRPGLFEVSSGNTQPTDGSDIWVDWSGG